MPSSGNPTQPPQTEGNPQHGPQSQSAGSSDTPPGAVGTPCYSPPPQVGTRRPRLPDPPGFPDELLKRREEERQFLTQLLDGSKVEQYTLPVSIKAELRK